ncbi:MAG TPA: sensor domain-containing diguanylate cyclase [Candidatus Omnitrophica bacterium]|nr:MAG: hypothetical protein DRP61_02710 [Candidatus Omnitrophota bacterium]RKY33648.1 MAG: hypothetical protein DRP69_06110 [Candidatus Omnitrophota bacterium]RKY43347.1 MAG: hypothetical protein DRP80_05490 [Candidatus Omnitrophota bacterium]HEC68883.1 sensor domain-containing diguanylate cyclase [Candidatus Omnitrophota bacterium]
MDEKNLQDLQRELVRLRTQFKIFYEITQALRTTLKLDEILYIILTAITAHEGLGFNRAALFFIDYNRKKIKGIMGIGHVEPAEAEGIWKFIEQERKDLYDLIEEYHRIKKSPEKPKFFELVQSLEFPLDEKAGLLYETFSEGFLIHLKKENREKFSEDPLYKVFLFEEAVFLPLWAKNQIIGILFVDNFITKKPIQEEELNILNMFASQAALAIENSKLFEDTLFRAHTDSLTNLWNYGYFQYKLDELLDQALRFNKRLSLLMIDIDDFKMYNDEFGHLEGDKALINIASLIKNSCRKRDLVCRYGGEEFAVILPEASQGEAYEIAERIRASVEDNSHLFKRKFTVSIGIASFPEDCQDKYSLVGVADSFLYQAKREGKNRVSFKTS